MHLTSGPQEVGQHVHKRNMRTFLHVLINTAVANLTTNFLWFALVFWVYLETRSILATGFLSAIYMVLLAMCSMWFGSMIDRYKKHKMMLISAWCSLVAFIAGGVLYFTIPSEVLLDISTPLFWLFTLILLSGSVVELLRNLALTTTVTLLVPRERHARANGLVGTVQGIAFIATSVFSGLSVGWLGMGTTLILAVVLVALPIAHLYLLQIPEPDILSESRQRAVDFRGGMVAILAVPGLFALVMFTTMNNLAGGVFMTLLDPYGLNMFPVELWGVLFGVASTGYVAGGAVVAKWGLGENPIRTMLLLVAAIGLICALFTLREWPWLFVLGVWCFMALMPAIEASEQTVIQRVVPYAKQGRVFGLAMTFEAAAAPLTAFLIAPMAEFWIVPYVESDRGAAQWEWMLGAGDSRGIALIFLVAGLALFVLPLVAGFTRSYRVLSAGFMQAPAQAPVTESPEPTLRPTATDTAPGADH